MKFYFHIFFLLKSDKTIYINSLWMYMDVVLVWLETKIMNIQSSNVWWQTAASYLIVWSREDKNKHTYWKITSNAKSLNEKINSASHCQISSLNGNWNRHEAGNMWINLCNNCERNLDICIFLRDKWEGVDHFSSLLESRFSYNGKRKTIYFGYEIQK